MHLYIPSVVSPKVTQKWDTESFSGRFTGQYVWCRLDIIADRFPIADSKSGTGYRRYIVQINYGKPACVPIYKTRDELRMVSSPYLLSYQAVDNFAELLLSAFSL